MISMEDNFNGRWLQWKMTSLEDNFKGRRLQWKTTKIKFYSKKSVEQLKVDLWLWIGFPYFFKWLHLVCWNIWKWNLFLQYSLGNLSYCHIQQSTFVFITCSHAELDEVDFSMEMTMVFKERLTKQADEAVRIHIRKILSSFSRQNYVKQAEVL